jgi:hypothetical protein
MTYRNEGPEQHKNAQHWISICVSLACKAGTQFNAKQKATDRVLWWCIFTRDRLIALSLQRPPVIKDDMHIPVPVLQLDDFQISNPCPTTSYAVACYGIHQKTLERIFIEKTKLCRCIKDDAFSWSNSQVYIAPTVSSRQVPLVLSELELSHWLHDLPESIAFSQNPILLTTDADIILHFNTAWLRLIYLKISSTLNHQLLFLLDAATECPVLTSASEVASILGIVYQKNFAAHYSVIKEKQLPLWLSAWMVPWPCQNCQMGRRSLEFFNQTNWPGHESTGGLA